MSLSLSPSLTVSQFLSLICVTFRRSCTNAHCIQAYTTFMLSCQTVVTVAGYIYAGVATSIAVQTCRIPCRYSALLASLDLQDSQQLNSNSSSSVRRTSSGLILLEIRCRELSRCSSCVDVTKCNRIQ